MMPMQTKTLPPLNGSTLEHYVAWFEPHSKFLVARADGSWDPELSKSQNAMEAFLVARGVDLSDIRAFCTQRDYRVIEGVRRIAGGGPLVTINGSLFINSWVQPTIQPSPGAFPRIEAALRWLTGNDPRGYEWLIHWSAAKIQDPMWLPKTAVLFTGSPGSGKNFYGEIMRECLGRENTAHVHHGALESNFNHRWADKFFVFADECVTSDNARSLSEKLKVWIANSEIEVEAKFQNQRHIPNRLAWCFASNDDTLPLKISKGDRRYTVFSNFEPISDEHRQMLVSCFGADGLTFEPGFRDEISAFYDHLLKLQVDTQLITKPLDNEVRADLIKVNDQSHHTFFAAVDEYGIDYLIDQCIKYGSDIAGDRKDWDWGDDGLSSSALYHLYVKHCKDTGSAPMKIRKLGMAIRNNRPDWSPVVHWLPHLGRQTRGYRLPRTPRPPAQVVSISGRSS